MKGYSALGDNLRKKNVGTQVGTAETPLTGHSGCGWGGKGQRKDLLGNV